MEEKIPAYIYILIGLGILYAVCEACCFVLAYWQWFVGGLILVAIIALAVLLLIRKRNKIQEQRFREEARERDKEARKAEARLTERIIGNGRIAVQSLSDYTTPCLLVDTNIWMDEDCEGLLAALEITCRIQGVNITVPGVQYNEICKKKKDKSSGEDGKRLGRIAHRRIEQFHEKGLLHFVNLTAHPGHTYADPVLVKHIIDQVKKGVRSTLITNDRDLRIRAKESLSSYSRATWEVIGSEKLKTMSDRIVEAHKRNALMLAHECEKKSSHVDLVFIEPCEA
ncbi:hypothetical protein P4B35_18385 [Pontiellaceae bacterium B12227]|nr:hypothetical protein [Pontiellaceae bacterium B12227]